MPPNKLTTRTKGIGETGGAVTVLPEICPIRPGAWDAVKGSELRKAGERVRGPIKATQTTFKIRIKAAPNRPKGGSMLGTETVAKTEAKSRKALLGKQE